VALVYPNNDPLNFICAFYGCVMAGVVPVPIEVPITRRVSEILRFILSKKTNEL
jgi:acyl-CoA synthetase (AMP-forming)/AMP-acid ligase II